MPSNAQIQELTGTITTLMAANEGLERSKANLELENTRLTQRVKFMQVLLALLLGVTGGLIVGFTTGSTGAVVQVALGAGIGAFFGIVMAAMAIVAFLNSNR